MFGALLLQIRAGAEEYYLQPEIEILAEIYETEDISAELIQAVIWTESRGDASAISADGNNVGLMQLHRSYFTGDLTDPENNVRQGAEYLQQLFEETGNIPEALMRYHGEADAAERARSGDLSDYAKQITLLKTELEEKKWITYTLSIKELCRRWRPELTRRPERS